MQVRLHDVLAYLTSARGRETLVSFRDQLVRDGADLSSVRMDPPGPNDPLPTDVFERAVTQRLYESFFAPQDLATALPAAVADTLAAAADRNGMLDSARVNTLLGRNALNLLSTIATRTRSGADNSAVEAQTMTLLDVRTRGLVAASAPAVTSSRNVYDAVQSRLGAGVSLARFTAFGIGEIQPQTTEFIRALGRAGLPAASTHWLSDPPRTHAIEVERLRARGVDVSRHTDDGGVSNASIGEALSNLFATVQPGETRPRFLLVDEDGRIARYLHDFFPQHEHLCVIVEQRARAATLPALNAATVSIVGTSLEATRAQIQAERAVNAIETQLRRAAPSFVMTPKEAVVEGDSERSRAIVTLLRARGYTVHVAASAAEVAALLPHAHLLIGTSGAVPLGIPELTRMPTGAVIASAAPITVDMEQRPSKGPIDREIVIDDAQVIRSTFQGKPIELGRTFDLFQHFVVHMAGGDDRLFLRAGTDIALDTAVPPQQAQVDGALTLAAVFQAIRSPRPGATTVPAAVADLIRRAH